jgi:hypothetical protein
MPDTSPVDIHESFLDMEQELELLQQSICGVYFWERIRDPLHRHLLGAVLDQPERGQSESIHDYLAGSWLFLRNSVIKNPFFSGDTDLLFYSTGRRKKSEDGFWEDIYHDPIIESLNQQSVLWERPHQVSHHTPVKTPTVRYTDLIEYAGTLSHTLGLSSVSLSDNEHSLLTMITDEISSKFGVDVPLESMVKDDLSKRRVRLPLYRKALSRVNPDIALLTTSYQGRETFVEACDLEDITVAELQHGNMSRFHMGYSYPNDSKHVFPDYFFAFGEFWLESVDLPLSEEHCFSVGYPHMERQAKKFSDVSESNQIIIISQPELGDELSQFAAALSDHDKNDHDVVYKLHPKEVDSWEEKYPHLVSSRVTCVADDVPLYRLFSESQIQVGVYSTAVYEGFRFGLETYILDLPGAERMEYLVANDYAESVQNVDDIISKIKRNNGAGMSVPEEHFFERNPITNIQNAIELILRESPTT